jgi:hypothetical protein
MHPLLIIPAALLGFFAGVSSKSRKGLSMTPHNPRAPLDNVPFMSWDRFVSVMVVGPKNNISKRGHLGAFGMDARRLKDVGAMVNARKGARNGEVGVWIGEWSPPLTEAGFLGSMPLQYAVFVREMRAAAPKVSGLVGEVVDGGVQCSLSGLLGVSHAAGEGGVESWVRDAATRKRFPGTTELFGRTNQIF